MNKLSKIAAFFLCWAFVCFFASCSQGIHEKSAYIVFSSASRDVTVTKDVIDLTKITLTGKSGDNDLNKYWDTWAEVISSRIELKAGDWEFTLTAFLGEDEYKAETSKKIYAGQENVIEFVLEKIDGAEDPEEPVDPEEPEDPVEINTIYVSVDGSNNNSGTSADFPLDLIRSALNLIENAEDGQDWEICIIGEITEATEISLSEGSASSLILSGKTGNTEDILNGNSNGTTLTIRTMVPVTIKNLKITGGNGTNGGGLYISENSSVVLSDGAVIAGNTAEKGGGVYNEGKLFMCGTAVVGDESATSTATYNEFSNKSSGGSGGGIYMNNASSCLYLGYSDENTEALLTGGIYHNYTIGQWTSGAGISCDSGKVIMASGNISYNAITDDRPGGGVFISPGSTFIMSGGEISYNYSGSASNGTEGGGAIRLGGTFTMSGGSIINNTSGSVGGGISIGNSGLFTMTGGTIKGNTSKSNQNINIESGSPTITIGEEKVTNDNLSSYNTDKGIELP